MDWLGQFVFLLLRTCATIARGRILIGQTVSQMTAIGVNSVPVTLLTVGFSGMVMALQSANTLRQLGMAHLVGGLVAVGMAREMAPVLTAIVVTARVGSAIAAELGTMVVTEQVDALRSLGVSPVRYLVAPRFLAGIFMLPLLTVFANFAGIAGGYLVSVYAAGISSMVYLRSAQTMLYQDDLLAGLSKSLVFGAIIVLVGCNQGLRTRGGAAGVGRSTTASVVIGIVLVYAADYVLASVLFADSPIHFGF